MSEYAWQVDSNDRCQKCQIIAYTDDWRGKYTEDGYLCTGCQTSHHHGDLGKEIERLRWEIVRLKQENADLKTCILAAIKSDTPVTRDM